MFFDTQDKSKHRVIQALKQTKPTAMYTHKFNLHFHCTKWETLRLISQYISGLKKNVHFFILISQAEFTNFLSQVNFVISLDNTMNSTSDTPTI